MRFRAALLLAAALAMAAPAAASPHATFRPTLVTMSDIPVFFLEPTDRVEVSLRRMTYSEVPCPARPGLGHVASVLIIENAPAADWAVQECYNGASGDYPDLVSHDDPRWPSACEACGEAFTDHHPWRVHASRLFSGAPDGRLHTMHDPPVGAMWDMTWVSHLPSYTGPDGIALAVRTPGGDWYVDGQASNCTRPGEAHKCWIRHGDPRDPQGVRTGVKLHVDKRGDTCAAGAGSIVRGSYHGFLHGGRLTNA